MSNCNCVNELIIPDVTTPKGSKHNKGCSQLKSYLFYYEDSVDAWVPVPKCIDGIIGTESLDEGEELDIRFKRFDMTEEEYQNIPLD
ncbi:hypothetical protein ACOLXF_000289 [Vibrio fluvialis]